MWRKILSSIMIESTRNRDQEDIGSRSLRSLGVTVAPMDSIELVHLRVGGGDVAQP